MIPIRDSLRSRNKPVMVWLIVLVNGWIFWYQLGMNPFEVEDFLSQYGVIPNEAARGLESPLHLLTTLFLHEGWLHIVSNMWALWVFGRNIEDQMGKLRFLAFYLLCGLGATLAHVGMQPDSALPLIGASGSICGVLGAYLLIFPRNRIVAAFPILFIPLFYQIPSWIYIAIAIGSDIVLMILEKTGMIEPTGIAFGAHIGGFFTGILLHRLFLGKKEAEAA